MSNVTLLGIDIAKNVFQLHGVNNLNEVILRKKLTRNKLIEFIAKLPSCVIAMEACSASNYWYRKFTALGHMVRLISPQFVKPYVKTNKNDYNDAEAICEAASRPTMRFVSPKNIEQQDLQSIHRIRSRLIQERTALANQIRGLLSEYGIIIAKGIHKITKVLPSILEDTENELSYLSRQLFNDLYEQILEKNTKIREYDNKLQSIFNTNSMCKKIEKVEGIGIITATAIIATIGDPTVFKNGRHFSAFMGLVPRQNSSGNKQQLLGISKRGNKYIRMLLIHGARSAILRASTKEDKKSKWIMSIKERRGMNKACVALANKNARTVWTILAKGVEYAKAA
jgi:transposase